MVEGILKLCSVDMPNLQTIELQNAFTGVHSLRSSGQNVMTRLIRQSSSYSRMSSMLFVC